MNIVTVSPKFQVVIPRRIRERLRPAPGQKVQATAYDNRIELIPIRSAKAARGMLRGMNTNGVRDRDRL